MEGGSSRRYRARLGDNGPGAQVAARRSPSRAQWDPKQRWDWTEAAEGRGWDTSDVRWWTWLASGQGG